jgi:hypothetical protein
MARGFESKDVEYQQAERDRLRTARDLPPGAAHGASSRRRAIELSLSRMRAELERARVPAHRSMIAAAIATLESELASLP